VVKTAVLEEVTDEWPGKMLRRAQLAHSGTIWVSNLGLALSRLTPPPSTRKARTTTGSRKNFKRISGRASGKG
jgi:hypothetical protein